MTAVMVPVWAHAVRKVRKEITKEKMPLLGVGAAFSFLGMMFNVPLPGGTTGHAVGGTMIAVLLGPDAACIAVTVALVIQAFLFGDGGILSLCANCFNMAFVLPYLGYGCCRLFERHAKTERGKLAAAGAGAYIGINAAAFCAAVEFGLQPLLFKDSAGQALYCPYPLSVSVPVMAAGHLTVAGIVEILYTVGVLAYVRRTSPQFIYEGKKADGKMLWIFLMMLAAAVPFGLLASGTAWGEWGPDEISSVLSGGNALGYTPQGMADGFSFRALFPDYSFGSLPGWFGYILSAAAGGAVLVILFRLVSSRMKDKDKFASQEQ